MNNDFPEFHAAAVKLVDDMLSAWIDGTIYRDVPSGLQTRINALLTSPDPTPSAPAVDAPARDEREAFEHQEQASNLERDDEGDYLNPCVQSAWEGWQARAALSARAPEAAAGEQVDRTAPFSNCQFRECDLPGQCRSEGKCHHPVKLAASGQKLTDALYILTINEDTMEEAIERFEGSCAGEALKCVLHAQKELRALLVASDSATASDKEISTASAKWDEPRRVGPNGYCVGCKCRDDELDECVWAHEQAKKRAASDSAEASRHE